MSNATWPWPGDTALDRARRIANSLLVLLPEPDREQHVATAHQLGETWLGGDLLRWTVDDIVSTAVAAGIVHVQPPTIRKWHSERCGLPNCGRGRYRVGDVLDYAALKRARRVEQRREVA